MKNLNIKQYVIFITILWVASCKEGTPHLERIRGANLQINQQLAENDSIVAFVNPYKIHLNQVLDSALAYAPQVYSKTDGILNTSAGNLMADIVLSEARPVYLSRTGANIDFAVLNHGGIRSEISVGPVSRRTAFQVMPFENTIVVAEMSGKGVRDLISFLISSDRPHPVSGIKIEIDRNKKLKSVTINGVPFDENQTYHIATSSYLAEGGDEMVFFKDAKKFTETDYKIRNAMVDYFQKTDTLKSEVDDRFIQTR